MVGLTPGPMVRAQTFCFEEPFGHVEDFVGCVDNSVGRVRGVGSGVFFQQESSPLVTFFSW